MNQDIAQSIGSRLRIQREAVGMKINQLAKAIGTSRNTITSYEAGRTAPTATDLVRIAAVLGCTMLELVADGQETEQPIRFAFRAHRQIADSPHIRVAARKCVRAYREIEFLMDAKLEARLPDESFDPDEIAPERWIPSAATRCRELLGFGFATPERIALLLERLGVRTLFFDFARKGLDGLTAMEGEMSLVMLHGRQKAVERVITSAAHELGHLVLHPQLFTTEAADSPASTRDFEKEAKLFAGHFLVPTDDLLRVWKDERLSRLPVEHALLLLKRVFHVSYWLLFMRLCHEGLTETDYPQLVYRTKTLLGVSGKADMETLEPEPMKECDVARSSRFDNLIRSAFLQQKIGVAKVAELLQIPVDDAKERTFQWMNPQHELVG